MTTVEVTSSNVSYCVRVYADPAQTIPHYFGVNMSQKKAAAYARNWKRRGYITQIVPLRVKPIAEGAQA